MFFAKTLLVATPLWIGGLDLRTASDGAHCDSLSAGLCGGEVSEHMIWMLHILCARTKKDKFPRTIKET